MTDIISKDTFPNKLPYPLTASLPDHLKDPANFEKIQKAIYKTFATKHSHGEMLEWAKCGECSRKMVERRLLLKRFGFKNPAQYMEWRKIHETIRKKYPLMDWST